MKLTEREKEMAGEYGEYFNNTGGNDIVEFIERDGITLFNNGIAALLQASCYSQLILLMRLKSEGLLKQNKETK